MNILPDLKSPFLVLLLLFGIAIHVSAQTEAQKPQTQSKDPEKSPLRSFNSALPKWLRFSGQFRDRLEGRTAFGFRPGANDTYDLTRLRINLEISPQPWIRGFVQAQDARVLGIDPGRVTPSLKDVFDLRQSYVEFGGGDEPHVSLRVGRQELIFGTERLIGASDWTNTARTFDAARLTIAGKRLGVDVFASSVVVISVSRFDKPRPGENFYGAYGFLRDVLPRATVEPYVLWKTLPHVTSETGVAGDADIVTVGFRGIGTLPGGFDYSLEAARQGGHYSSDTVSAWAAYGIWGYTLPRIAIKPRLSAEYDYATGDRARGDGNGGTFDQLYPTNHSYYGIADQVGWRNIRDLRTGIDAKLIPKTKLAFDYHFFWLASGRDGLYNASGALVVRSPAAGAAHLDIGREADVYFVWSPWAMVRVGAGFAHLFPGRFLKENSPGSGTSFPYAFMTYDF